MVAAALTLSLPVSWSWSGSQTCRIASRRRWCEQLWQPEPQAVPCNFLLTSHVAPAVVGSVACQTTSDPDSIAPFFADSVHPIYQPQAPWKQKILAEEAHMREHAVHAAAPLDGVTQHVGGPSDVPTPMHAPASAGGAGEAAADASHAMVTPPVLQLRDDHAIVDPRLHAPAVKPRPEPSHPRGGASTRGRGAAAPTDNHIVS